MIPARRCALPACSKVFAPNSERHIYCDSECEHAATKAKGRERYLRAQAKKLTEGKEK